MSVVLLPVHAEGPSDYFYIVESGNFDVFVRPPAPSGATPKADHMAGAKMVAQIAAGGSFGELALMYNAPRAATVVSAEQSTLWALDRVTFRRILMDSAFQRRRMYEGFLEEVSLLASLTPKSPAEEQADEDCHYRHGDSRNSANGEALVHTAGVAWHNVERAYVFAVIKMYNK